MATVYQHLEPESASPVGTAFPQFRRFSGTNFSPTILAFDAATKESCSWDTHATNYGSGNLTVQIYWAADTATSGDVIFGAQIAAITADTDTQDITTDGLATASTVTDTHLGTTARRLHLATITVSNLDSLANGDDLTIVFYRDAAAGGDTMTGDAWVKRVRLSYSDT